MAKQENPCSYERKGKLEHSHACTVLSNFFLSVGDMIHDMETTSEEMKKAGNSDYMKYDMWARELEDLKNKAMAIGRSIAEMSR